MYDIQANLDPVKLVWSFRDGADCRRMVLHHHCITNVVGLNAKLSELVFYVENSLRKV